MITYHSDGFRPIRHDKQYGMDSPRAAAAAFAARLAHREFGQRGHCRTIGSTAHPKMVCTTVMRHSSARRRRLTHVRPPVTTCGSRSISNATDAISYAFISA